MSEKVTEEMEKTNVADNRNNYRDSDRTRDRLRGPHLPLTGNADEIADDYVMVPKIPTEKMINAAAKFVHGYWGARRVNLPEIYRAMTAAANETAIPDTAMVARAAQAIIAAKMDAEINDQKLSFEEAARAALTAALDGERK